MLLARRRRANVAGSDGAAEQVARIIAQIRWKWPRVRIVLRADSGFANDPLMRWREENGADYVFGPARNARLEAALAEQTAKAERLCTTSGKPARVFCDFRYQTRQSWSRARRVVGKAEHTPDGANPRFVLTSLKPSRLADPRALYEDLYCARGEAENRIGEQLELFADRASSATMAANQLRMSLSAMAYVLLDSLRRIGLRFTQFADASAQTIRLKLLKLGARCVAAFAASTSRSPRHAPIRSSSNSPIYSCGGPSVPPDSHPDPATSGRPHRGPRTTADPRITGKTRAQNRLTRTRINAWPYRDEPAPEERLSVPFWGLNTDQTASGSRNPG